ncbi:unnamed protein product [Sympodiomycopsis kandeliae]
MPPFEEKSEQVCENLWREYHHHISMMRRGLLIKEGPYFLGEANDPEAHKFSEWKDRRYPIWFVPIGNQRFDVYLVGDPSFTHEAVADHLDTRIASFVDDVSDLGLDQANRLAKHLRKYLRMWHSPKTPVNVRQRGSIKNRKFLPGTAMKEPDGLWVTGRSVPERQQRPYCALEVAYRNEGIPGLMLELKLWSQIGESERFVSKPLNFVGISVSNDEQHVLDGGVCFIVIVAEAADKNGNGAIRVVTMNASALAEQECREAADEHNLQCSIESGETVHFQYSHFCPPLLTRQEWVGRSFAVTRAELEEVVRSSWAIEEERALVGVESNNQLDEQDGIVILSSDD